MTRTRLTSAATACAAMIALATLGTATPASAVTDPKGRPTSNPGMTRMDELMSAGNPGMARMDELMSAGNAGMARMCELMLNGPGARAT